MCWELTGIWHGQRGCLQKKTPYLCRDGPKIAWSIKIDNSNYNLDRFSPFFYKYAWKCVETLTKWLFWRQFEKSLEFFAFFFLEWLFLCQFDIFSSKYFYEMSAVVWWCHKVWYDDFVMNEWNKWINILNALDISMNMKYAQIPSEHHHFGFEWFNRSPQWNEPHLLWKDTFYFELVSETYFDCYLSNYAI